MSVRYNKVIVVRHSIIEGWSLYMSKWWMIRAGDHNELIHTWKEKGIASIGWPKLGNPKDCKIKNELLAKANDVFSESKPNSRNSWVSQVWRFSRDIQKGDHVITYSKEKRDWDSDRTEFF